MNDAQIWTVLAAAMGGTTTVVALTLRMVRVEIGAMRAELGTKIDHLDRDVQTVINRMMG